VVHCGSVPIGRVYRISFHNPQQRREYLVHALAISYIRMHFAPNKQYIQHHVLSGRLAEIHIVRHASLNILEYLGTEFFVGTEGYPW
jgi:hypothetical protein